MTNKPTPAPEPTPIESAYLLLLEAIKEDRSQPLRRSRHLTPLK